MSLYVPKHFRVDDDATLDEFLKQHSFAVAVSASTADGVLVSHVPGRLVAVVWWWVSVSNCYPVVSTRRYPVVSTRGSDNQLRIQFHLARQNQHAREIGRRQVVLIFQGPHAYISSRCGFCDFFFSKF